MAVLIVMLSLLISTPLMSVSTVRNADASVAVAVPNASVIADGPEGSGYASTDVQGKYVIMGGLRTGTYNVSVIAEGYLEKEVGSLQVTADQETQNVDFFLSVSGGISGSVTDAISGQPLQGISIWASSAQGGFGWSGTTDANGRYRMITNLATGTYNVTIFMPEGHVPKTVNNVAVTAGQEVKGIDFALDRSGIVTGKVTASPSNDPVEKATVSAFSDDGSYFGSGQTDATGRYRIDSGLGTGKYTVMVSYEGVYDMKTGIDVTQGQETSNVDLSLTVVPPIPSGTIKGRVTDASNNPIMGAVVTANGPTGSGDNLTDIDGEYEISDGLGTGVYTVNATALGYASQQKSNVGVTANQTTSNVDFQLQAVPSGRISGTVTGDPNPFVSKKASSITCSASPSSIVEGQTVTVSGTIDPAVPSVTVSLEYTRPDSSETTRTVNTSSDGKYSDTFTPPAVGAWSVKAFWAGNSEYTGAVSQSATFAVTQGAEEKGILVITVKDAQGNPISGASVSTTAKPSGQSDLSATTGADGKVTFSNVSAGSYAFQVSKSGYVTKTASTTSTAGGTVELTITLDLAQSGGGGGGIPGFPYESIVIGLVIGAVALWTLQRRR
jgi:hypothetical protein